MALIWASPEKTTSLEVLYKLQKRAARIIMLVHYQTHAEPLIRKFKILSGYDLCKSQILIFVYKSYNNLLPPICTNFFTHAKNVHQYSTRSSKNSNLYRINANKSCRIHSIAARGPNYWNLLTVSLKLTPFFSLLKVNLKEYSVSQ